MAKQVQKIKIGVTSSELFCFGFEPPVETELIKNFPRDGLQPGVENNTDGSQTVGYKRNQFGWSESDRWDDFENFAVDVKDFLEQHVLADKVVLDLEPKMLDHGQTSLYKNDHISV